jgi:transcriptional regulator with XRE-family HTH domain
MAKRGPRGSRGPTEVDKLVGRNIRIYRLAKDLSQTELGNRIGLTFQQVQKYEKGVNRVGSGRLLQIATVLGIHVTTLFEGTEGAKTSVTNSALSLIADAKALRLAKAFSAIATTKIRRSIVEFVEHVASGEKSI